MNTLSDSKLRVITRDVRHDRPTITSSDIRSYCLADWPEGESHQGWLNTATAHEIATWVIMGIGNR